METLRARFRLSIIDDRINASVSFGSSRRSTDSDDETTDRDDDEEDEGFGGSMQQIWLMPQ